MSVYAATEAYEEFATISEQLTKEQGIMATVLLRTPWAKRWDLVAELVSPDAYPYPDTPAGWDTPYPINCGIQPDTTKYTVVGQKIEYEWAKVQVQYGYVDVRTIGGGTPEEPEEQIFIAETLEPTSEMLTKDYKMFRWKQSWEPVEEHNAPGVLRRSFNLTRQHFNVMSVSPTAMIYPGTCNIAPYTSQLLGWQFPAQTLMFNPPVLNRTITNYGSKGWNVTVKFSFQKSGWNRYWRDSTQQWEQMSVYNPDTKLWYDYNPITPADFSAWLF